MSIAIENGIEVGNGITIGDVPIPPVLKLSLDAAGYTSGPWVDTISSRSFTLNGGVAHSSDGGGSFVFDPSSNQYASCISNLNDLSTWTVEVWHYYDGTNTGIAPCIITEVFPGVTSNINYNLGCVATAVNNYDLTTGYFNGTAWENTGVNNLSAGNWYQIVGTFDGTNLKQYINDTLYQTTSAPGTPISSQGGINLMKRWDNNDYWGGKLAIVKVYDGALTASDVTTSWNANKARFGL